MSNSNELHPPAIRPAVGVAVFILRDEFVLLGRRRSQRGFGQWSTPGGHLEPGEDFEECAVREAQEEAGVEIDNTKLVTVTNDVISGTGEHFVTVIMIAQYAKGRARVRERSNFFRWGWFDWRHPPSPLSAYVESLWRAGFDPQAYVSQPALPINFPRAFAETDSVHFPDENQSAKDWLIANGHSEVVQMIDDVTDEWRARGKETKRNWWAVLAGDSAGQPRTISGRQFPVFQVAQLRQGWVVYKNRRAVVPSPSATEDCPSGEASG